MIATMKLNIKRSAGLAGIVSALAFAPSISRGQTNFPAAEADAQYGLFHLLDHRSSYGKGIFPEPFLVDDSDLELNEVRLDWIHTAVHSATGDEATAELEKGFGPVTLEGEIHYERDVEGGAVTDGIGNIDLGARCPFYQYVSGSENIDLTLGAAVEVGIPVHSSVSKNAEFVPKVFGDLRLGDHVTIQAITGYSMLFGPGEDGGAHSWEYGIDLGYSIQHDQLYQRHFRNHGNAVRELAQHYFIE